MIVESLDSLARLSGRVAAAKSFFMCPLGNDDNDREEEVDDGDDEVDATNCFDFLFELPLLPRRE